LAGRERNNTLRRLKNLGSAAGWLVWLVDSPAEAGSNNLPLLVRKSRRGLGRGQSGWLPSLLRRSSGLRLGCLEPNLRLLGREVRLRITVSEPGTWDGSISGAFGCLARLRSGRVGRRGHAGLVVVYGALLNIPDLLLQDVEALLILPDFPHDMVSISRVKPVDEDRDLADMAVGVFESGQRRGLDLALLRVRGEPRVGPVGVVVGLVVQLLPQQVQEELLEGLGAQSAGIVGSALLDQRVVLEEVGGAQKICGTDAVGEEGLE
jgi:hypothetical protein